MPWNYGFLLDFSLNFPPFGKSYKKNKVELFIGIQETGCGRG